MVPIKFRCYRCNQLLGVSPSKIGAVVACPKCAAELVVPDPDESDLEMLPDASTVTDPSPRPAPAFHHDALDPGVASDLMDIRPQDIRVEPGVYSSNSAPSPEFMQATGVPADPYATSITPSPTFVDEPPPAPRPPAYSPAPATATMAATAPPPARPAAVAPTVRMEAPRPVPAIKVDEPVRTSSARPGPAVVRSRDMVLPRSVVASWSLFVLLALMFAFLAGLLAGHYVWRVHEPVRRLGLGPVSRLTWVRVEPGAAPLPSDEW